MKAKDVGSWSFDGDVENDSIIECPRCGEATPLMEWHECDVPCDECGSHSAMVCPECEEAFDHVWGPEFHVIPVPPSTRLEGDGD